MEYKLQKLYELGVDGIEHLDGSFIDHLKGTKKNLKSWKASKILQDAGLYHAVYGTSGFNESLVSPQQREKISEVIGKEAEEIVYLYCACDREDFWSQIGTIENPKFRNRFTGKTSQLTKIQLCNFCELTVANELEIAIDNPAFIAEYGENLSIVFNNMKSFLTNEAYAEMLLIIGKIK